MRIILGHNPFFGVDHLSQDRGDEKAKRFEDDGRIVDFLREYDGLGIDALMLSTHPRAAAVADALRADARLARWRLYPLVPYINKYVRGANEKGLVNLALDVLAQASLGQKLRMMVQGGRGLLAGDVRQALSLLLDVELVPFGWLPLGAVFLHDALTDLALGLGLEEALELFRDHVERHYGVPAGLVTKNLPRLRERLEGRGWPEPLLMASFNGKGFAMNPSPAECAEAVRRPGCRFVAINTLASGALPPAAAYRYLAGFPNVRAVVVGVSRREHAVETVDAIRRHLERGDGAAPI